MGGRDNSLGTRGGRPRGVRTRHQPRFGELEGKVGVFNIEKIHGRRFGEVEGN